MFLNKLRITNKQINKIETQNLFTILYQNPYTLVIGTKITSPPPQFVWLFLCLQQLFLSRIIHTVQVCAGLVDVILQLYSSGKPF